MTTTMAAPAVLTLEDIEDLARAALDEHGLTGKGWRFGWDQAVKRLGCCHYTDRLITLSRLVYEIEANRADALDTILHEVAHALAGYAAGHGGRWRAIARQVGARPLSCNVVAEPVPTRWVGRCECPEDRGHGRERLSSRHRYLCNRCRAVIVWERRAGR